MKGSQLIVIVGLTAVIAGGGTYLWVTNDRATASEAGAKEAGTKRVLFYRHPMRPEVTSPVPAKDEMGMDYIPVYDGETSPEEPSDVPGRIGFTLAVSGQQLTGVTTTEIEKRHLSTELRVNGRVAFDPELFNTVEEYRLALKTVSEMGRSSFGGLREQSTRFLSSAKTKLKLLGLSDDEIEKLASSQADPVALLLPQGSVWIYAEVFEYEVGSVKIGQVAEVLAPSVPQSSFSGTVGTISPVVNPVTRTVRVRVQISDPLKLLRPDTFVTVRIKVDLGIQVALPESAVLHSGEQDFVFVADGPEHFVPRTVAIGPRSDNYYYQVLSGVADGERVVTSANFLIDSESRLRSALQRKTKEESHD